MSALQFTRAILAIVVAALCLGAGYSVSQMVESKPMAAPDSQKLLVEAYEYFDTGEFEKSQEKFESATKVFPENGEAWFMLGMIRHYAQDYDTARKNFERSLDYNYRPGLSHFNIGCGYSLEGDKPMAIYSLQLAVKAGLTLRSHYATDPDLKSLHDEPEFKALLASLAHPLSRYPDAVIMEGRIGSWDVFDRRNSYLGTLRSSMALNGYGIDEHLVSATGLGEQSLFLYDSKTNTWMCTFATAKGAVGQLKGAVKNGKLQVTGPMSGTGTGIRRITIEFTQEKSFREIHELAPEEGMPFSVIDTRTFKPYQG